MDLELIKTGSTQTGFRYKGNDIDVSPIEVGGFVDWVDGNLSSFLPH